MYVAHDVLPTCFHHLDYSFQLPIGEDVDHGPVDTIADSVDVIQGGVPGLEVVADVIIIIIFQSCVALGLRGGP